MRANKPIVKNPEAINYAEIGRATGYTREYVRLIVLGIKGSSHATASVKKAIKEQSKLN